MGKFAGFLKRAKNLVNTVSKGIKTVKGIWNNWITKPGVGLINMILLILIILLTNYLKLIIM